jgi:hypothetical protein
MFEIKIIKKIMLFVVLAMIGIGVLSYIKSYAGKTAKEKGSQKTQIPQFPRVRTFYVDFDNGSDTNEGTLPQKAFKHCPGDSEAVGTARNTTFKPGDWVIFKGGVNYRSTVNIPFSGEGGNPIVYDGNSEGSFGIGKAIIHGGELVTSAYLHNSL